MALGRAVSAWCDGCKAFTAATTPLLLVTLAQGVEQIGSRTVCPECTDGVQPETRLHHG